MQIELKDESIREYAKQHVNAAIKSIVRSEISALIHEEIEKKLKDLAPHKIQIAVSGILDEKVKKAVDGAFETLNKNGVDTSYPNWSPPVLFVQKMVFGVRDELKEKLWKYVSARIGVDLNPKIKKGE